MSRQKAVTQDTTLTAFHFTTRMNIANVQKIYGRQRKKIDVVPQLPKAHQF